MASIYRIQACAKVNLFLEITGKRADGYHTLSTVFQTISLADELTLNTSETLRLTCSDPSLPTDERNLAFRAAARLREVLKEKRGVHIHLNKKVPMGAGLGGGSSDAGTLLPALLTWWKRRLPVSELLSCARQLGADVPFFLQGGTSSATGIGDRLRRLPALRKTWLVLVYPGFGVSTKEAYGHVKLPVQGVRTMQPMVRALAKQSPSAWKDFLFNRFEEFVFPGRPELPKLKQDLLDAGCIGAVMSGSGSSMVGLVSNAKEGRRIWESLRGRYPQSWLVHTL